MMIFGLFINDILFSLTISLIFKNIDLIYIMFKHLIMSKISTLYLGYLNESITVFAKLSFLYLYDNLNMV